MLEISDNYLVEMSADYAEHSKDASNFCEDKGTKLLRMLHSTILNPINHDELFILLSKLRLKLRDILEAALEYNFNIYSLKENLIYSSLENRFVLHLHNLLLGSWHIERQNVILDFIKKSNAHLIADFGFGVPSRYIKEYVLVHDDIKLTLVDFYSSAFDFAKILLNIWSQEWKNKIFFYKTDMNMLEFIGDFELYILQDSLEHILTPSLYLDKYVKMSASKAKFLISLPIGPIIPRHFISWETKEQAEKWIMNHGLYIEYSKMVFVNPEVDLFAEAISSDYADLIMLCSKGRM